MVFVTNAQQEKGHNPCDELSNPGRRRRRTSSSLLQHCFPLTRFKQHQTLGKYRCCLCSPRTKRPCSFRRRTDLFDPHSSPRRFSRLLLDEQLARHLKASLKAPAASLAAAQSGKNRLLLLTLTSHRTVSTSRSNRFCYTVLSPSRTPKASVAPWTSEDPDTSSSSFSSFIPCRQPWLFQRLLHLYVSTLRYFADSLRCVQPHSGRVV